MSRTDLDAHTLARSLRRMAGDGSVEWVMEPIQADVLRDIADMLDDTDATGGRQSDADLVAENAKLRERIHELEMEGSEHFYRTAYAEDANRTLEAENAKLRELLKAAYKCTNAGPSCLECRIVAGGCTLLSAMRELGVEVYE